MVKTKKEHVENLEEVLKILEEYELQENREKRVECKEKVAFLGYEIQLNKISSSVQRAQEIVDYERPRNIKRCRDSLA